MNSHLYSQGHLPSKPGREPGRNREPGGLRSLSKTLPCSAADSHFTYSGFSRGPCLQTCSQVRDRGWSSQARTLISHKRDPRTQAPSCPILQMTPLRPKEAGGCPRRPGGAGQQPCGSLGVGTPAPAPGTPLAQTERKHVRRYVSHAHTSTHGTLGHRCASGTEEPSSSAPVQGPCLTATQGRHAQPPSRSTTARWPPPTGFSWFHWLLSLYSKRRWPAEC